MKKILVAGASGHLGRYVTKELDERGHWIRALVRDAAHARSIEHAIDDTFFGDVTKPETLRGACDGIELVFSSVGAPLSLALTEGRVSYQDIDHLGNKNLLDVAARAGVQKFVYVSVFGAHQLKGLEYVRAHESFVGDLERSGITHAVVRPTGFFSSLAEILQMARRGVVMSIGAEDKKTNPIHEEDLAAVCVDALESGKRGDIPVGGPETYTRREIAELAFAALGKKPRLVKAPVWMVQMMLQPVRLMDKRLYALLEFLLAVTQMDLVAPAVGTRRLETFFRELARAEGSVR